jgi:hypothetical protein
LEGIGGWRKLHEEIIWKEQEAGENYTRSLFGRNRRLEKITRGDYLEGTGGWRKLHEEIIWKEQEAGENYMRRLFGRNRRLEKVT